MISSEAGLVRDVWSFQTWRWAGGTDTALCWLITVDASVFDGDAALTEESITKTLDKFEKSLRARVTDHRQNKWNLGVRPPRPKTRKTEE